MQDVVVDKQRRPGTVLMKLHARIEGQDSFVLRICSKHIFNNVVTAPIKSIVVSKVTRFCSIEAASRFCSVEVELASRFVAM
jgi:hypothetical protein